MAKDFLAGGPIKELQQIGKAADAAVVEYAGSSAKPRWVKPKPFRWDYTRFGRIGASPATPAEAIDIAVVKHNAALAASMSGR